MRVPIPNSLTNAKRFTVVLVITTGLCLLLQAGNTLATTREPSDASKDKKEAETVEAITYDESQFISVRLKEEPAVAERSWESRPYQVAVWMVHQGTPSLAMMERPLATNIESLCTLRDASGWFVRVGTPPSSDRYKLFQLLDEPELAGAWEEHPLLQFYDKLIIVRMTGNPTATSITVREHDLQTAQWGPKVERFSTDPAWLPSIVTDAISQAFMPLAIIDRVDEKDKVHMRVRGIEACTRVVFDDDGNPTVEPQLKSPVYVKDSDRFLPIIRTVDRSGKLVSLKPIDFTFLTVDSIEGNSVVASIQSTQRAPLAQRKSKRAEKLAIVIRPPNRPSVLHLQSLDKENPKPLEGYEVWGRKTTDTKDDDSTYIGKTNWLGDVVIPPHESGLRLIYIKRGSRALRKLPIIPGFKDRLVSSLPNDNARLYAEGVIRGYGNEIINLVVQRQLLEQQIESEMESDNWEMAEATLLRYKNLESPTNVKLRMSDEEVRLKSLASDDKEYEYIASMFQSLKDLLNSKIADSREIELQEKIQNRIFAEDKKEG